MAESIGTVKVDLEANVQHLVDGFNRAEKTVSKTTKDMKKSVIGFTTAYLTLQSAISAGRTFLKYADDMTTANSRLRLVTQSSEELLKTQKKLFDMAQNNRASYISTADLYQRIAQATKGYNIEQSKVLMVTNAVSKAMTIGGGSAESQKAALMQLGQAFSADFKSIGQEMASLREQAPRVYKALREGIQLEGSKIVGISEKTFRKMAENGELSNKMILDSFGRMAPQISREFDLMVKTVEQGKIQAINSMMKMSDELNREFGINESVAALYFDFANILTKITPTVKEVMHATLEYKDTMILLSEAFVAYKIASIASNAIMPTTIKMFATAKETLTIYNQAKVLGIDITTNSISAIKSEIIVINEKIKVEELNAVATEKNILLKKAQSSVLEANIRLENIALALSVKNTELDMAKAKSMGMRTREITLIEQEIVALNAESVTLLKQIPILEVAAGKAEFKANASKKAAVAAEENVVALKAEAAAATLTGKAFAMLGNVMKRFAPTAILSIITYVLADWIIKTDEIAGNLHKSADELAKMTKSQGVVYEQGLLGDMQNKMREKEKLEKQLASGRKGGLQIAGLDGLSNIEKESMQARIDTLQQEIDGISKAHDEYEKISKLRKEVNAAYGEQFLQESRAASGMLDELRKVTNAKEEELKSEKKRYNDRKNEIKSFTKLEKEQIEELTKTNEKYHSIKNADIEEKYSKKAISAQKEANTYQLKAMEILNQKQATESAIAREQELSKKDNFTLDLSRLTELQKLNLIYFDEKDLELKKELKNTDTLSNAGERDLARQKALEAIYNNLNEKHKARIGLQEKINDGIDKEIKLQDQQSSRDLQNYLDMEKLKQKRAKESPAFERTYGTKAISNATADSLISSAQDTFKLATDFMFSDEEIAKNEAKLKEYIESVKNHIATIPDIELNLKLEGFNEASTSIANLVNGFKDMADANEKNNEYLKLNAENIAKANSAKEDTSKLLKEQSKLEAKSFSDSIMGYGNMAGALASFTKGGSKEYKALMAIQQIMYATQMASQLTALATSLSAAMADGTAWGSVAIAKAIASAPPPFNTPAIAYTTAAIAALGFAVAMFGSSSNTTTSDAFSAQKANTGTGSVLGDTSAQSESIKNSLSVLEDMAKPEFRLTSQMAKSLNSIDNKIGGMTSLLIQQGGFAFGEGATLTDSSNNGDSYAQKVATGAALGLLTGGVGALGAMGIMALADITKDIPVIGNIAGGLNSLLGSITSAIFGSTKTHQYVDDSGLNFNNQNLLSALDKGIQGQAYQTILTTKNSKNIFGQASHKKSYDSYFKALDEETNRQFSLVLSGLYDTTKLAGKALDASSVDIDNSLKNFVISIGKISLKGKTGDEIQATLTAIFGKIGDDIAKTAFPLLESFQKVGEGMFTTLTRVATGMEEAGYYIDRLGNQFSDIKYTDIINQQGDVGFEALKQSIVQADDAMYGFNNGVVQMIDTLSGTASELYDTYILFEDVRRILSLTGQDAKNLSSSMLLGAGGINELSDAMNSYFKNFLTKDEQQVALYDQLKKQFEKINLVMPDSVQGFKTLIGSIDTSTDSGAELYGRLILLSDSFAEVYGTAQDSIDIITKLKDTFKSLALSVAETIKTLLGNINPMESQRRNIEDYWKKRNEADTLLAKNSLTQTETDRLSSLVGDINSLSTNIQSGSVSNKGILTGELVSSLSVLEDALNFKDQILSVNIVGISSSVSLLPAIAPTVPTITTNGTTTTITTSLNIDGILNNIYAKIQEVASYTKISSDTDNGIRYGAITQKVSLV